MAMKIIRARASAFLFGLLVSLGIGVAIAGLETGTYISDLVATNPLSSDLASTGDDHLRLIKSTLKNTFPNINGAVTATDEQLSALATPTPFELENAAWRLLFDETDAASNERLYDIAGSAGQFLGRTRTDADAAGNTWLTVDRTGTTVDSIALSATAITLNGVAASDYARLSQSNTLTAQNIFTNNYGAADAEAVVVRAAQPAILLDETDASADEKRWITWNVAGQWRLTAVADNELSSANAIVVDRTGTTADSINLAATAVTATGNFAVTGQTALTGVISPSTLGAGGSTNDYDPTGLSGATVVRIDPSATGHTLTGLAGGTAGRVLVLFNINTTGSLNLAQESASSTAANRFACNSAPTAIASRVGVVIWYDGSSARWRCISAP